MMERQVEYEATQRRSDCHQKDTAIYQREVSFMNPLFICGETYVMLTIMLYKPTTDHCKLLAVVRVGDDLANFVLEAVFVN